MDQDGGGDDIGEEMFTDAKEYLHRLVPSIVPVTPTLVKPTLISWDIMQTNRIIGL